jgi:hypothetical protein
MTSDEIEKYLKDFVGEPEYINGGLSLKKYDEAYKNIIKTNPEFRKCFNENQSDALDTISSLMEKICEERNKCYYNNKISSDIFFNVDELYTVVLCAANHKDAIEKITEIIRATTNNILSDDELRDLANCVYSVTMLAEIDSNGAAYHWYSNDCPKHKELFKFDFTDAVFKLGKEKSVLYGHDGYIWKKRSDLGIPDGIPGTTEYLFSCYPTPTFNENKEYWEQQKKEYIDREREKSKEQEYLVFRSKYLGNTKYKFSSVEEYDFFKSKIFDDVYTKYPYLSLTTYYYRAKISLEENKYQDIEKHIQNMLDTKVSYSSKKSFFTDILSLLEQNDKLYHE